MFLLSLSSNHCRRVLLRCFPTVQVTVGASATTKTNYMSIGTILIILLILMLLGALPSWQHSRSWGYFPSGGLGLVLVILIILVLLGKI